MTDPLSPDEIAEYSECDVDGAHDQPAPGWWDRLCGIAEDHARLHAENAALTARVAELVAQDMAQAQQLDYEQAENAELRERVCKMRDEWRERLDAALSALDEATND